MENKINLEQLKENFNKNNIRCIEGTCVIPANTPIIEVNELDEYIDVLSNLQANYIFYSLRYNDEDDYIINKDYVLDKYGETAFNLIKDKIDEYNKSTKDLDFNVPYGLNLYFIKDNIAYLFYIENDWLDDLEIFEGSVELSALIEDIEPELEYIENQHRQETEDLREELKELILNDEDFKFCTNQSLRSTYARQLMNANNFTKYRTCFETATGYLDQNDFRNFIELLWKKMNAK